MSLSNFSKVLLEQISDQKVATIVANALRKEHQNDASMVKEIGLVTGANLHSINKWCQALNAPKSAHLLILAGLYPEVLKALLELIGRADVWEICVQANIPNKMLAGKSTNKPKNAIYRDKYVPINVVISSELAIKLNQRQLWFLGELQHGKKPKAENIAAQWQVSDKTAKRDISDLLSHNLIIFNGARKNGFYSIK